MSLLTRPAARWLLLLTLAPLPLLLGGCRARTTEATAPPASASTHELTQGAPWYEHPAQARPPNGLLPAGTRVRVLQEGGSYTHVQAEDGTVGYVSTDVLRPLPPAR